MTGRWRGSWLRRLGRPAGTPDLRRTPLPELSVQLPLLWPEGPDRAHDPRALRLMAREYARSGRRVEDLLDDLDTLCGVIGIAQSSHMIESSTVAWSDAFLDTVGSQGDRELGRSLMGDAAIEELERRLRRPDPDTAWDGLVVQSRLLVVEWQSTNESAGPMQPDPALESDAGRVVDELRTRFRGTAIALVTDPLRVVATVPEDRELRARVDQLEAWCRELSWSPPPRIRLAPASVGSDEDVRRYLRRAG